MDIGVCSEIPVGAPNAHVAFSQNFACTCQLPFVSVSGHKGHQHSSCLVLTWLHNDDKTLSDMPGMVVAVTESDLKIRF